MESLQTVSIRGNPLSTIPTVFHGDWDKIKKYLNTLTDRRSEWRERKVSRILHFVVNTPHPKKRKIQTKNNFTRFGVSKIRKNFVHYIFTKYF